MHIKVQCGLGNLHVINKTKQNKNKQPSLIDRLMWPIPSAQKHEHDDYVITQKCEQDDKQNKQPTLIKNAFFSYQKSWGKSLEFGAPCAHSHTWCFVSDLVYCAADGKVILDAFQIWSHGFSNE